MVAVLFVCMGNICRSPMAEGAFQSVIDERGLTDQFQVDSAGTIGYHAGNPPDERAQATAKANGIDISHQRSRKVVVEDFERYDYILAMDNENFDNLMALCPPDYRDKIHMFLGFAPDVPLTEMPDPYYGHAENFEMCFTAAVKASHGLLETIMKEKF